MEPEKKVTISKAEGIEPDIEPSGAGLESEIPIHTHGYY